MEENKKRVPWATWEVEGEEYKLKLTTSAITKLEEKYKVNLLDTLNANSIPPLRIMLEVTQGALQKYHHGIKLSDVSDMFDTYVDEGGSQIEFMQNVFIPIFAASGFFSKAQAEQMEERLQKVNELAE